MRDRPVLNILRPVKPVSPEDTVGRAAEALRTSGLVELPVVSSGVPVGLVSEREILAALVGEGGSEVAECPVKSVMSIRVICAGQYMSVGRAAEVLDEHKLQILPVVDDYGIYVGVITRSDVTSALCLTIRPPVVAGMATPLGVYLTTGHVRAGAGISGCF